MNDAKKAAKTRRELIKAEEKRQRDAENRLESLRAEYERIAKPILEFKEAEKKMRQLAAQIDGARRSNAALKADFKRELSRAGDPVLLKLIADARRALNRPVDSKNVDAIQRTLDLRGWLDQSEPALQDSNIDDDDVAALIERGNRIMNTVHKSTGVETRHAAD